MQVESRHLLLPPSETLVFHLSVFPLVWTKSSNSIGIWRDYCRVFFVVVLVALIDRLLMGFSSLLSPSLVEFM